MKRIAKYALGAFALAGAAALTTAPADARVFVGFGVGPGYYGPGPYYGGGAYCNPYSPYYDPYYCDGGYYGDPYWGGPVVYGGWGWGGGWGHHWGHDHDHWGGGHWGGGHWSGHHH